MAGAASGREVAGQRPGPPGYPAHRAYHRQAQAGLAAARCHAGWLVDQPAARDPRRRDRHCPVRDHATSGQLHREFKSDLDLGRPPSGKFDTNDLVLALRALTHNLLRRIGLTDRTGELSPVRHRAKRRRLRTVMQEPMCLAARVVRPGRWLVLRFGIHCPGDAAFGAVYHRLDVGWIWASHSLPMTWAVERPEELFLQNHPHGIPILPKRAIMAENRSPRRIPHSAGPSPRISTAKRTTLSMLP